MIRFTLKAEACGRFQLCHCNELCDVKSNWVRAGYLEVEPVLTYGSDWDVEKNRTDDSRQNSIGRRCLNGRQGIKCPHVEAQHAVGPGECRGVLSRILKMAHYKGETWRDQK